MSSKENLVSAIVRYLKDQLECGELSEDQNEGVSIGIQCLEVAYNIDAYDLISNAPCGLEEIFMKHVEECVLHQNISQETLNTAETLKNEGNIFMNEKNFTEAVNCYTKAIILNPRNAFYYCNRAAAYNNLKDYDSAIMDCNSALKYDPSHHKAYARLGVANMAKGQYKEAVLNYQKAVELQPENDSYQQNLEAALYKQSHHLLRTTVNINVNGASTSFNLPDLSNLLSSSRHFRI